jgi:hypothetical protein
MHDSAAEQQQSSSRAAAGQLPAAAMRSMRSDHESTAYIGDDVRMQDKDVISREHSSLYSWVRKLRVAHE